MARKQIIRKCTNDWIRQKRKTVTNCPWDWCSAHTMSCLHVVHHVINALLGSSSISIHHADSEWYAVEVGSSLRFETHAWSLRWVDTRTVALTPPPARIIWGTWDLQLSICHTVMNWTLLVFGSVCLLVLGEDAFVQGKRNARTVTFTRTAWGNARSRRDTWTGQPLFTACKTPLSPKERELLFSHTHEVRTILKFTQSKYSLFIYFLAGFYIWHWD